MKAKAAIGLAMALLLLAGTAQAKVVGNVTVTVGPAKLFPGGTGAGQPARKGADVSVGDRIETGPGGRVKVFLTQDNSVLQIGEETSLVVQDVEYNEQAKVHRAWFKLASGKVRVIINRVFGIDADAKVETPTAVAGVTGTSFIGGHDPALRRSTFLTLEGRVKVAGTTGKKAARAQDVDRGQITFVSFGADPTKVRAATAEEMQSLMAATEVPGPPPTDLNSLNERDLTDSPIAVTGGGKKGEEPGELVDPSAERRAADTELEPIGPGVGGPGGDDDFVDDDDDVGQDAETNVNLDFPSEGGDAQTEVIVEFPPEKKSDDRDGPDKDSDDDDGKDKK